MSDNINKIFDSQRELMIRTGQKGTVLIVDTETLFEIKKLDNYASNMTYNADMDYDVFMGLKVAVIQSKVGYRMLEVR